MTVEFALGDAGDTSNGTLAMGLPLLSGLPRELLASAVEPEDDEDGLQLWRGKDGLVGFARVEHGGDIEGATGWIYARLLRAVRRLSLYRIWNCVPQINGESPSGLENYRAFCRGRSLAFEAAFGDGFAQGLPAASGVGTADDALTVAFLAGPLPVRHFENPSQVPAYEYPPEHGPRAPSFARATVVGSGETVDAFISGTSAVVGHDTVAPGDTPGQVDCTLRNLALISKACGLGERLGSGPGCTRHYKVYLRNAGDLSAVEGELKRRLFAPGDSVSYLGAEICRAALNVEVEVAIRGSERS
jgi:chorismate lyase / 3-hydroxybenzoate synthase